MELNIENSRSITDYDLSRVLKKLQDVIVKKSTPKEILELYKKAKQLLNENKIEEAIQIYEDLYKKGETKSLYYLGKIYKTNEYNLLNSTKSKYYFLKGSVLGDANCQFEVGYLYSNHLMEQSILDVVFKEMNVSHSFKIINSTSQSLPLVYYTFGSMGSNVQSEMALGYRYYYGYGVPKHCKKSANYYKSAAERDDIRGGGIQLFNEHVRLNDDHSLQQKQSQEDVLEYFKYTANKGITSSQLIVGYANMYGLRGRGRNPELAREYFERAAQAGEREAFGQLGNIYAKGIGVPINNETALKYYRKGMEMGDSGSMNGLGYLYMKGGGVKQDYKMAAYYFNMSANKGNAEAQYNLGLLYMTGLGVSKDYKKAHSLFQASAAQGQTMAHYQLGNMYLMGLGVPIECETAVKHYKRVAEKGKWLDIIYQAYEFYQNGEYRDALLLYEQAAEQGIELAQSNAAYLYDKGYGDELYLETNPNLTESELRHLNYQRALHWYQRASDQGNVDASLKIGDYYYYGLGTQENLNKSVQHYRKAASYRNAQALFNLGYMHQYGIGLPKDFHLSKRYYDMSAEADTVAYIPVIMALAVLFIDWGCSILYNHFEMIFSDKFYDWIILNEDLLLILLISLVILLILIRQLILLFVNNNENE